MKIIIILLLGVFFVLEGTLAQTQKTTEENGCKTCGDKPSPGILALKYICDNKVQYKVTNCIPFSDVEIYSSPSGGKVVAMATADKDGDANFLLSEEIPVSFALNSDRLNEKGVSGKGQIFNLTQTAINMESPKLRITDSKIQLYWNTNLYNGDWNLLIQRSVDGKNFTTINTINAVQKGYGMQQFSYVDETYTKNSKGLTYRIRAQHLTEKSFVHSTESFIKLAPEKVLFITMAAQNKVQVRVTKPQNLPATYIISDVSGRKLHSGVITRSLSSISLDALKNNSYLLSIEDKKKNILSEWVNKQ